MSFISTKHHSSRGSALIVALIFAALIAISLTSYISLANSSLKQASRSFYASSGMNLAETGLELAGACFNRLDGSTVNDAWDGWTLNHTPYNATTSPFTPAATRTFTIPNFNAGPGAGGTIKVFAQHFPGITKTTTPKIVAQAIITQHNGPPINKYIEVILRKRSMFGSGISAIDNISSTGGTISLRSWDSDPDNDPSTAAEAYTDASKTAGVTVASQQGNINLGGGTDVLGFATVSPGHTITAGSVHDVGTTTDDPDRLSYDFDGNFPVETAPSYSPNLLTEDVKNTSETFPRPGDFAVTVKGKEIYCYYFGPYILQPGGSNSITITAGKDVVFIFGFPANLTADSISMSGSQTLVIGAGATLKVYTPHNVDLGGGGVVNNNVESASFQLFGTNPTPTQLIKISGSSQFTGVINAPSADVQIKGGGAGGRFVGAVVGKTVTFTGSTEFIFDEALNDLVRPNYGIAQWKELQSQTERLVYDSVLNF
jgi:hypothetical protein